jgi:DNA-binding NtrC family response regulator
MANISSVVEKVVKRYTGESRPELEYSISTNLEFRMLFPIDTRKPFKEAKKSFLKNYLNDLLTLSLGNISLAAKKANMHRRHFYRMISELEIDPEIQRRELLKPSEYIKGNVHYILEETLSNISNDEKIQTIYTNLDDISEIIAQSIDSISYDEALDLFEKEFISKTLKENSYDIEKSAEELDMSQRTLYRKMSKFGLSAFAVPNLSHS